MRLHANNASYLCWLLLPMLLVVTGCTEVTIDREYGRRSGIGAAKSVNGTATLATMYKDAGNKVQSWRVLSPKLLEADTIVWIPDKFDAPGPAAREWLQSRFLSQPNRTLVYVGRDYDAAPGYWEKITPLAPPEQSAEVRRRWREAKSEYQQERASLPATEVAEWFDIEDFKGPVHEPTELSGPWSDGVDASKVEIALASNLLPPEDADVLLESDEDVIASRRIMSYNNSQLIVISNGSFLLNLPLVNHEHRKLAGKLIDESSPGKVIFLQTGGEDPKILDKDPSTEMPTGMEVFFIEPWNFILLNLGLVGVIFCFARWPIFGVPRQPVEVSTSDFGRHVAALGEMLKRTKDVAYATARIQQYQQQVRTTTTSGAKKSS